MCHPGQLLVTVSAEWVTVIALWLLPRDWFPHSIVTKRVYFSYPKHKWAFQSLHYLNVFRVTHGLLSVLLGICIFSSWESWYLQWSQFLMPLLGQASFSINAAGGPVDHRGDPNTLFLEESMRCLEFSLSRKLHANTALLSLFEIWLLVANVFDCHDWS